MSKKINVSTLSKIGLEELSSYNQATVQIRALRSTYLDDKKKVEKDLEDAKKKRDKLIASGKSVDEAINEAQLATFYIKLESLKARFQTDCKPYNKAQSEILSAIDNNFYPAYVLAEKKGNFAATGSIEIKTGKKSEEYQISKDTTFQAIIRSFIESLGITGTENKTAMDKFVKTISIRIGGMKKDNDSGFLKCRNKSDMKHMLVRGVLQYLAEDRKIVTVNEDGSVTR